MKKVVRSLLCLGLFGTFIAPAFALPGDPFNVLKARMSARSVFTTRCFRAEMSGEPACSSTTTIDGAHVTYRFAFALGARSYDESIAYAAKGFDFMHRGDPRVREVLSAVYDPSIARDFADAKPIARLAIFQSKGTQTFLRGKRFGYATGGIGANMVDVFTLRDLKNEIAHAQACANVECGD